MSNYSNSVPAVFGLNKYLWAQLKASLAMDESQYAGLVPIIPIQEEPQFLQAIDENAAATSGMSSATINYQPYITYHWFTNGYQADSWNQPTDSITYTVYSLDQTKLRQIILLIIHLFKQYDRSAQAVNDFIGANVDPTSGNGFSQVYHDYHYNYITIKSASGGSPVGIEGDAYPATVMIQVNYTSTENDQPLP